ncbi:polysialyltransferase family glycosyltransferase [Bacteroides ovatus]|jgi:hypothetical protein|uniref:polysialyltransferase family glycosyltransferase n=1 Tax=Bacteroides ovatus TaxID=28116 RepID=UPI0011C46416|nr:polysialyltransferase family glycosyltransferase [Bacteroides ovatus]
MNNLFICHSQAQLLLAVSLTQGRFAQDENHLILFVDFNIKTELKEQLKAAFYRVLYRTGTYPAVNKSWKEKLKRYPSDLKTIKHFMDQTYHRVFEVCDDCIPELFALRYAYIQNNRTEYIWLEDGSYPYFRNTIDVSGFSSNPAMRLIRKVFLKYLCGLGRFYDFKGTYMGANVMLKQAYLTFPGKQRKEYMLKDIVGITDEEFKNGLSFMFPYKVENELLSGSVFIVMDKLDVYKDLSQIEYTMVQVIEIFKKRGKMIYYKYHPREESALKALTNCKEINRFTGVENYYSASLNRELIIIGIKSTGLQNAKKLGFHVISIAPIVHEDDENVLNFYRKIQIQVITSLTEL